MAMARKKLAAAILGRSFRTSICLAGLSLFPLGCAAYDEYTASAGTGRAVSAANVTPAQAIQLVKAEAQADTPERLPTPNAVDGVAPVQTPAPPHVVPVTLGTIFRLAEDQNAQIALARARIDEAHAGKELADKAWLPEVSFGTAWFRHEGGIANQDGTLQRSSFGSLLAGGDMVGKLDLKDAIYQQFVAERQLMQQEGELRRVTYETLLDASNTYVDLMSARTAEAMAREANQELQKLLERAQKAVPQVPQAGIEVARISAALRSRELLISQMQEQAARASAKLVYLLGLDPCATIAVADDHLVPIDLIDPNKPVCDLVNQALTMGPGVVDMERMLALIDQGIAQANGPSKYLPIVEAHMLEGGFGTGPGASTSWDNRFDLGLQVRWNLTQLLTQQERQHLMRAKTDQAQIASRDLKAKLTAGVQESYEVVSRGREAIRLGEAAIADAKKAQKLIEERMDANLPGVLAYADVMQGQQATALARLGYLSAVHNYNQAQLRLFLLTGAGAHEISGVNGCATKPGRPE
jgi:outer membrane protein TolC